jgi:hypothetical protein
MFDKSALFMQNKPNFRDAKMNINTTVTMNYVISSHWLRRKNKANSNPIKPKTNPIQTQLKPKQTQFKANLTQLPKGQKMLEFTLSLSPRTARLTRNRGMLAHLLWSLPSGVPTCFSTGGRGLLRG